MSVEGPRNRLLAYPTRQLDPAVARDGRIVDRDIVLVTRPCEVVSNGTDNAEPICSTGGDPPSKTFLLLDDRSRQRGPRGCGHFQRHPDHGGRPAKESYLRLSLV
jgi:hypothetical protein